MSTNLIIDTLRTEAKRAEADINQRTKIIENKQNFSQVVSARLAVRQAVKKVEAAILDLTTAENILNSIKKD